MQKRVLPHGIPVTGSESQPVPARHELSSGHPWDSLRPDADSDGNEGGAGGMVGGYGAAGGAGGKGGIAGGPGTGQVQIEQPSAPTS